VVVPETVIVTAVLELPPHLSHSWITVLYVPAPRVRYVFRLAPETLYART